MPFNDQFAVKPVLDTLRTEVGDAEFGYRVQGLFSHVLLRIGARILEVNAKGHPDIKAEMRDSLWFVQVKSVLHGSPFPSLILSVNDVDGVMPVGRARGYLALLDCAEPVEFVVVPHDRLSAHLSRIVYVESVRADRDGQLSDECTQEFVDLIQTHRDRLRNLTFGVLSRRALHGDGL